MRIPIAYDGSEESDNALADLFMAGLPANALDSFFIGSVSSAVAAHAKCPVEIVRAGKPARGGRA